MGLNALIFIGEFIGVNAQSDEIELLGLTGNNSKSLNDLYNKTKDSVVQISTEYQLVDPSDGPYYLGDNSTNAMKFGSGFVYDKSGTIITAYHIVSSANNIMVTFNNGNSYNGLVVGVDPFADVSILKLDNFSSEQLAPVTFSNSSNINVGNSVYVIGSPYGFGNSLTSGIISQINRVLPNSDLGYSIPNTIQIHPNLSPPGNGGSPLFDWEGKVIGMNIAAFGSNQSNVEFGFAIPSNDIIRIIPPLIKTGTYQHPWLGISGSKLSPTLAEIFGLPLNYKGVLIEDVVQDGPADKAGLKGMLIQGDRFGEQQILDKDIIIAIDGNPVSRIDDILSYLEINKKVGDKVDLTVNRNGQTINLIATLEAIPNLPLQEIQSQSKPNYDNPKPYTPFPNFKLPPLPELKLPDLPNFNIPDLSDSTITEEQNSKEQNEVSVIDGSDQRTYLAFDGSEQKSFADCVSDPETKRQLSNLNHITSSSLYQAVDKRIADLSILNSAVNKTNNLEQYKLEEELDCLEAVRYLEKETIYNFYQSFADMDTYLKDYAKEYMGIDENGNIKKLKDCSPDIDLSDGHKFWLEFMSDAYYYDAVGWQRFADHDCLAAVLYLQSQQNNITDNVYSKSKVSLPSKSDLM